MIRFGSAHEYGFYKQEVGDCAYLLSPDRWRGLNAEFMVTWNLHLGMKRRCTYALPATYLAWLTICTLNTYIFESPS